MTISPDRRQFHLDKAADFLERADKAIGKADEATNAKAKLIYLVQASEFRELAKTHIEYAKLYRAN